MTESERKVAGFLTDFLMGASQNTLKMFVAFVTGSTSLPTFGLKRLEVQFSETQAIFASTCLCQINLPNAFESKEVFNASLNAVLSQSGKSFNCV